MLIQILISSSFHSHSILICHIGRQGYQVNASFHHHINVILLRMMLDWHEWWWNEGHFLWRWFWSSSSLGHPCHFESSWNVFFVNQWSFEHWMTIEWMKWCLNDYFLTLEWWLMTQMRVEWWNFWSKANALDFFLHHSTLIPTIFYHLTLIQWVKWVAI